MGLGMNRVVLALGVALRVAGMAVAERPNVVWIVADDMSPNFGCYGETAVATPTSTGSPVRARGLRTPTSPPRSVRRAVQR
jgi:hypothetical protein